MQLDPGAENSRQVLDQLPKINAPVRGEIENNLIHIVRKFHIHQIHGQFVSLNTALANVERLLFPNHVLLHLLDIFLAGFAQHRLQRIIGVLHLARSQNHLAKFHTPGCFHDSVVAFHHPGVHRVKIIYLASFPKADTYNRRHASCPPFETFVQRKC